MSPADTLRGFFYPAPKVYLRHMNRLLFLLVFFGLFSCKNHSAYPKAENALDAGREFLDGFLRGNTEKAQAYMINDPRNQQLLMTVHNQYRRLSPEAKNELSGASIIIGEVDEVTENEVIIQYQSSYDKFGRKIKVIKKDGKWLVDLKYTLNPNM